MKNQKLFLISLFLIAFVIRAVFFMGFWGKHKHFWTADSAGYNNLAVQIAKGNGISHHHGEPAFYRLPLYPAFLAACYKAFDFDFQKTLWVQIILSCFIPILIFYLSLALFPENFLLAKLVAIFATFHNGFVIFSDLLMSESLFCLFFLLFLILFLQSFALFRCPINSESGNSKKIFFAGVFLGLASLVRPVGHYVILVCILLLLFSNFVLSEKFKNIFLLTLGWLLIVGWWLLRNYLLTGLIFFHTLPGKHFMNHSAAYVIMHSHNCSYKQAKEQLNAELVKLCLEKELARGGSLNEIEYCLAAEEVSYKHLRRHPILFLRHSIINILKTSFNLYSEEFFFAEKRLAGFKKFFFPRLHHRFLIPAVSIELLFMLLIWIGFLGFIGISFWTPAYLCQLLKVLPLICVIIFITLAAGFARLRLPIEPLLIIFSCKFWLDLSGRNSMYE